MHRTHNLTVSAADTDGFTPVTPADILRGAARYLELHGWLRHFYYGGTDHDAFPPACADGAIGMAAYGYCSLVPGDNHTDPGFRDFNRARDYLRIHLASSGQAPLVTCGDGCDDGCDHDTVIAVDTFGWNDDPRQTAEKVTATIRAAAADWEWQHATEEQLSAFATAMVGRDPQPLREAFTAWLATQR